MNSSLEEKIKRIYIECKKTLTSHEFSEVLHNTNHTAKEVWDEFADQIMYTNKFLKGQKDLYFLLTLLSEAKNSLTSGTPTSNKAIKSIDGWINQVNSLIKSYNAVIIGQRWILDYYNKGGGLY